MTYEDMKKVAKYLRDYANGIEKKLYMDMKIDDAKEVIEESHRLARLLDHGADARDTIVPSDLG